VPLNLIKIDIFQMNKMYQKKYWERSEIVKRRHPQHPVIFNYVIPKINELKKHIQISKQTRLLDVGCGNGFFTYYFDKLCKACGVDYSEKMLHINPVKNTTLMNANNLKFEDNCFDIVFCHALLHHVKTIDNVIQEMKRVSNEYIVILEPNRNNPFMFLFSLLVKEERGALKFSLDYLRNLMIKNKLTVEAAFSYGMIVPNKTPSFLLPLVNLFNFKQPLGITNFIIAKKNP